MKPPGLRAAAYPQRSLPGNKAYPVTARDMTTKEKRRYAEWKKR
jgi:hypothetical protein